ncbi:primase-polymerase (primpol)-like protein [Halarchaeum rubridurum]|uniref:Primase-polymerase (Primpol)-like protein n=1 Tax=Halarchaeum rubridurum TaxID=489911 RepID=A0A830FSC5_9EURY|nr:hypothetical protein [Halarchaeum rubridurum]MBP1953271.1 primase-polymerase (primpol)-like protein [Halarchaeum rubridurum]GGM66568.1 hypothetical protein GCM10009017_15830 [Halarchaeum rubridurum]
MSDATIPDALTACAQWVCWAERERDGKATKVPLAPHTGAYASVREPSTWASFEVAQRAARSAAVDGVGFVFTDDDAFVGVDLDDCRDPETGRPASWARAIVDDLDSYTEVSPSGTGFHVYVRGTLPDGGNRSGSIECYATARFFTVTGDWVGGTPTDVRERTDALAAIHAEHVAAPPMDESDTPSGSGHADDDLLAKARRAKNGEKFARLWRGDTSGYDSHSEADMALCFTLAFWTRRDVAQMDRLFRRSGLYRAKWDERHYADGRTYGEQTVARAARGISDVYEPSASTTDTSDSGGVERDPARASEHVTATGDTRRATLVDVEASIADLRREVATLTAHHDHLYESLEAERRRHERTRRRLHALEHRRDEGKRSWLSRFF